MKDKSTEETLVLDLSDTDKQELTGAPSVSGEQDILATLTKLHFAAVHGLAQSYQGKIEGLRKSSRRSWILRRILLGSYFRETNALFEELGYPLEELQKRISPETSGPLTGALERILTEEDKKIINHRCVRFARRTCKNYGTLEKKLLGGIGVSKTPLNSLLKSLEDEDVLALIMSLEKLSLKTEFLKNTDKSAVLEKWFQFPLRYMVSERHKEKTWEYPIKFEEFFCTNSSGARKMSKSISSSSSTSSSSSSESENEASSPPTPLKKLKPILAPSPEKTKTPASSKKIRSPAPARSPGRRVVEREDPIRRRSPGSNSKRRSSDPIRRRSPYYPRRRDYRSNNRAEQERTEREREREDRRYPSMPGEFSQMRIMLEDLHTEVRDLRRLLFPPGVNHPTPAPAYNSGYQPAYHSPGPYQPQARPYPVVPMPGPANPAN